MTDAARDHAPSGGRAWARPDRDPDHTRAEILRVLADLSPQHSLRRREIEALLPLGNQSIASAIGALKSQHLIREMSWGGLRISAAGLAALELDDEMRSAS